MCVESFKSHTPDTRGLMYTYMYADPTCVVSVECFKLFQIIFIDQKLFQIVVNNQIAIVDCCGRPHVCDVCGVLQTVALHKPQLPASQERWRHVRLWGNTYEYICTTAVYIWNADVYVYTCECRVARGRGLGSRPKKMYGERLGDGVEYHLMKPTPRR